MADTTLAEYVGADPRDAAFVAECDATAKQLVSRRVGTTAVPPAVRRQAELEVGANLVQRRRHSQGAPSFTDADMMESPYRPALDPVTPAMPLLAPYLGPVIG